MAEKAWDAIVPTHVDVETLLRGMRLAGSGIRNENLVSSIAKWISKRDDCPIEAVKSDIRESMGRGAKLEKESTDGA